MAARLSPARKAALGALATAARDGSYVRDVLDHARAVAALDARDAGLARRLALGVTACGGCLDEALDFHIAKPRQVAPRVRLALRVAAFELMYLGTPPQAAVSQGVELVRAQAPHAAGFANAVLHRLAEGAAGYLAAGDVPEEGAIAPHVDGRVSRRLVSAARRAGMPVWLASRIEGSLGPDAAHELFCAQLEPAPVAVHANPLAGIDISGSLAAGVPGCIIPNGLRALISSGALGDGRAVASDAHAQLVATAATRAGSCLEIGAGRGTKTFIMCCQARRAGLSREHVALDLYPGKCKANLERLAAGGLGHGVRAVAGDARDLDSALGELDAGAGGRVLFDTVLVDAPCSGTGTMRRHPETPWRLEPEDALAGLPSLQLEMLSCAASRVSPGGELLYATCSVLDCENVGVVDAFMRSPAGGRFGLAPVHEAEPFSYGVLEGAAKTALAHEDALGRFQTVPAPGGFDGHFCARMVRLP